MSVSFLKKLDDATTKESPPASPLTPQPPAALPVSKGTGKSPRSRKAKDIVCDAFFEHINQKIEVYSAKPIFGVHAVAEVDVHIKRRRSASARTSEAAAAPAAIRLPPRVPHISHYHSPGKLKELLAQAMVDHKDQMHKEEAEGLLTARASASAPTATGGRRTPRRLPMNYWDDETTVWSALERAGDGLQLISAQWLLATANRAIEQGEWDKALPPRARLPKAACLTIDRLQRIHQKADSAPKDGGLKRLPIIAISRDLDADADDDKDGGSMLRRIASALRTRMPLYAKPHGAAHPTMGPSDFGVFVDCASLESTTNPLEGAVGEAVSTLFAHRLVTVYLMGEARGEAHACSALYRALATLSKRSHDEYDPWPVLAHTSDAASAALFTPPTPIPPKPSAFASGGSLNTALKYKHAGDVTRVHKRYKEVCEDILGEAKLLDYSRPPELPRHLSWGDKHLRALSGFWPICSRAKEMRFCGQAAITHLPDAIGDITPPPPPPFIRGGPRRSVSARYAALETLNCYDCPELRRLPDSLSRLCNLRTIILDFCVKLHQLPDQMGAMRELRILRMNGCECVHVLPESLGKLHPPWGKLERVELDHCVSLGALPSGLGAINTLHTLSLYGCRSLRALPPRLPSMLNLHRLVLDGCLMLIGKLPEAQLKVLEERGCVIERPADPPPPCSAQLPTYTLGAMQAFTRKLYGLDMDIDGDGEDDHPSPDAITRMGDAGDESGLSGYGTTEGLQLATGDVYEGQWKDGQPEGRGVYTFADGRVYDSQWVGGKMHGAGRISYGYSNEFDGEFRQGRAHGHGTRLYADGDLFNGEYVHGKREGHGTYRFANGDTFEGEYVNDVREGAGVYTFVDGQVYEGLWMADVYKQGSGKRRDTTPRADAMPDLDGRDTHRLLLQGNEEMRARLRTMRGVEPINLRRAPDCHVSNLSCDELRSENAALSAFIFRHEHMEFVVRLSRERVPARTVIVGEAPLISTLKETPQEEAAAEDRDGHSRVRGKGCLYTVSVRNL